MLLPCTCFCLHMLIRSTHINKGQSHNKGQGYYKDYYKGQGQGHG